nr:nitrogen assimilation transcription factor nira [Quercus suber]
MMFCGIIVIDRPLYPGASRNRSPQVHRSFLRHLHIPARGDDAFTPQAPLFARLATRCPYCRSIDQESTCPGIEICVCPELLDAGTLDSHSERNVMSAHSNELSSTGAANRLKRQTILAACQVCRQKKVKCDGNRPCGYCKTRNLDLSCHFEANEDETHRIAAKRKHNEISQSRDELHKLFTQISSRREVDAADIFRRIRRREDPGTILDSLQHGDDVREQAVSSQVAARVSFLREVLQSPASVDEMLQFVDSEMSDGSDNLQYPSSSELALLRHEGPRLDVFAELLRRANSKFPDEHDFETLHSPVPSMPVMGRFPVPGHPWTNLVSDDAVTELISMFFNYLWPYWRLLERDLFLEAMRSERLDSMLCSPFLVNSILALASCYHDEAMRLWVEEEAHPSLTNVQGLMLLSVQCSLAGKDRLGEVLLSAARHLERDLRTPPTLALVRAGSSIVDYSRCRRGIAWGIGVLEVSCTIAHLRPTIVWKRALRALPPDGLPDVTLLASPEQWTGYPFKRDSLTLDPTTLWRERCKLEQLIQDSFNAMLIKSEVTSASVLMGISEEQIGKLFGWLHELPDAVQWRSAMPVPVFDLHAQYFCTLMTLHVIAHGRIASRENGLSELHMTSILHESLLRHTCQATTLLRQYRVQYGLKLALPNLVQLASMSSGLLLQTMQSKQYSSLSIDAKVQPQLAADIEAAFEESFRFLLSTGLQNMLTRALARMLIKTASETEVQFPSSVHKLLEVIGEAGWTSSDVEKLSSSYPNPGREKSSHLGDGMEDLLRRWEGLAPT